MVLLIEKETLETYQQKTLPFLNENKEKITSDLQWFYDIWDGKKEKERVVYKDEDFILFPDNKWNGKDPVNKLHLLAFVSKNNEDLRTIRDLTVDHLPLIQYMKRKSLKKIMDRYGFKEDRIFMYFHYHPTYFHLHIHFATFLPCGFPPAQHHFSYDLNEVIENLVHQPDYYAKGDLTCRFKNLKLVKQYLQVRAVKSAPELTIHNNRDVDNNEHCREGHSKRKTSSVGASKSAPSQLSSNTRAINPPITNSNDNAFRGYPYPPPPIPTFCFPPPNYSPSNRTYQPQFVYSNFWNLPYAMRNAPSPSCYQNQSRHYYQYQPFVNHPSHQTSFLNMSYPMPNPALNAPPFPPQPYRQYQQFSVVPSRVIIHNKFD